MCLLLVSWVFLNILLIHDPEVNKLAALKSCRDKTVHAPQGIQRAKADLLIFLISSSIGCYSVNTKKPQARKPGAFEDETLAIACMYR